MVLLTFFSIGSDLIEALVFSKNVSTINITDFRTPRGAYSAVKNIKGLHFSQYFFYNS